MTMIDNLVSEDVKQSQSIARSLHDNAMGNQAAGQTLKTVKFAESATGCMATEKFISIAHDGRIITLSGMFYSEKAKELILGVAPELVSEKTMYSKECVELMAIGVRNWCIQSDFGFSLSGVAGPDRDPEAPQAPVGQVYFGFTDGTTTTSCEWFYEDAAQLYAQAQAIEDKLERRRKVDEVRYHVMRVFSDMLLQKADEFMTESRQKEAQKKQAQVEQEQLLGQEEEKLC